MTEYESCSVKKVFKEKFICPYCKKEHEKTINVEAGTKRTRVWISVFPYSVEVCRKRKMFELAEYVLDETDHCSNCESFSENIENYDVEYEDGDIKIRCGKYPIAHIEHLGKCRHHEKAEKKDLWGS